jgi:hypothetical protein
VHHLRTHHSIPDYLQVCLHCTLLTWQAVKDAQTALDAHRKGDQEGSDSDQARADRWDHTAVHGCAPSTLQLETQGLDMSCQCIEQPKVSYPHVAEVLSHTRM